MKLPRLRLRTLLLMLLAANVAGLLLWSNLHWRELDVPAGLSEHESLLVYRMCYAEHVHTFDTFWTQTRTYFAEHDPRDGPLLPILVRGWPRTHEAQWGTTLRDPAALRFNLAICAVLMLIAVLCLNRMTPDRSPPIHAPPSPMG